MNKQTDQRKLDFLIEDTGFYVERLFGSHCVVGDGVYVPVWSKKRAQELVLEFKEIDALKQEEEADE